MKTKNLNQLYKVEWIDINHHSDWIDIKDIDDQIAKDRNNIVINYWELVKEDDFFYTFSSGGDKEQQFDLVNMPKGVVVKITKVGKIK